MKLIWITPECPYPPNTGGRVGIWKRIQYISEDNDIYLYSIIDDKNEKNFREKIKSFCCEVKFYYRCKNFKTLVNSIINPYPAVSRWNKNMRKDLEKEYFVIKPDFVVIDCPQMFGVIPQNILKHGKLILNQHNIEFQCLKSLADGINNPIKKYAYKIVSKQMEWYEKTIYSKEYILLYTFVSTMEKKFFEANYNRDNTFLVPVGAELEKKGKYIIKSHNLIFVAKMSYPANEEGAMWLINEIVPRVKKCLPDVRLYLVGKDPGSLLLDASKNNENVIVTGTVDSLDPYYEISNVATVPIMTGGGVNVKLFEALGHCKYVVTTSKGVEGTSLKHKEQVLVADDAETFANYCIELLTYPERYLFLIKNSFEIMEENYSWQGVVKMFENKLKEIKDEN